MGLPHTQFTIYRGTEMGVSSRLTLQYSRGTINGHSDLVNTKWLCDSTGDPVRFLAVDGREESDGWSCRMKIAEGPYNDYWLDSSDGWVCAVGSSSQRWKFLGSGDQVEWWQDERPVVVTDTHPASDSLNRQLRAQHGATPQTYTIRVY